MRGTSRGKAGILTHPDNPALDSFNEFDLKLELAVDTLAIRVHSRFHFPF